MADFFAGRFGLEEWEEWELLEGGAILYFVFSDYFCKFAG